MGHHGSVLQHVWCRNPKLADLSHYLVDPGGSWWILVVLYWTSLDIDKFHAASRAVLLECSTRHRRRTWRYKIFWNVLNLQIQMHSIWNCRGACRALLDMLKQSFEIAIIGMKWHEHQQTKFGSIITIHPKCLNHPSLIFIYDFPSYKPPFIGNSAPKLRTTRRWMPSKDTGCIGGRSFKLLNIQPRKNDSKGLVTLSGKRVIEIWYYPLVN